MGRARLAQQQRESMEISQRKQSASAGWGGCRASQYFAKASRSDHQHSDAHHGCRRHHCGDVPNPLTPRCHHENRSGHQERELLGRDGKAQQNSRPDPLPAPCASQSAEREADRHEIFRVKVFLNRQDDGRGESQYRHHQHLPATAPASRSSEQGDHAGKEHQPTEISKQHCLRHSARSGSPTLILHPSLSNSADQAQRSTGTVPRGRSEATRRILPKPRGTGERTPGAPEEG